MKKRYEQKIDQQNRRFARISDLRGFHRKKLSKCFGVGCQCQNHGDPVDWHGTQRSTSAIEGEEPEAQEAMPEDGRTTHLTRLKTLDLYLNTGNPPQKGRTYSQDRGSKIPKEQHLFCVVRNYLPNGLLNQLNCCPSAARKLPSNFPGIF